MHLPIPIKIYFKSLFLQLGIASILFILYVINAFFIDTNGLLEVFIMCTAMEALAIGTIIITVKLTFNKKYDIKLWKRIVITALSPGLIIPLCFYIRYRIPPFLLMIWFLAELFS
jgi:hypothetical protein